MEKFHFHVGITDQSNRLYVYLWGRTIFGVSKSKSKPSHFFKNMFCKKIRTFLFKFSSLDCFESSKSKSTQTDVLITGCSLDTFFNLFKAIFSLFWAWIYLWSHFFILAQEIFWRLNTLTGQFDFQSCPAGQCVQ